MYRFNTWPKFPDVLFQYTVKSPNVLFRYTMKMQNVSKEYNHTDRVAPQAKIFIISMSFFGFPVEKSSIILAQGSKFYLSISQMYWINTCIVSIHAKFSNPGCIVSIHWKFGNPRCIDQYKICILKKRMQESCVLEAKWRKHKLPIGSNVFPNLNKLHNES